MAQKFASFSVILGSFFRAPRICEERQAVVHFWTPRTRFRNAPGFHFLFQDLLRFPVPWGLFLTPPWKHVCGPVGPFSWSVSWTPWRQILKFPHPVLAASARPGFRVHYRKTSLTTCLEKQRALNDQIHTHEHMCKYVANIQ